MIAFGKNGCFLMLLVQSVAIALLFLSPIAWAENICPSGMVLIPGGTFKMGSDNSGFVEERSAADVTVDRFCMDQTEITKAQFAKFVQATGYVTVTERTLQIPLVQNSRKVLLPTNPKKMRCM